MFIRRSTVSSAAFSRTTTTGNRFRVIHLFQDKLEKENYISTGFKKNLSIRRVIFSDNITEYRQSESEMMGDWYTRNHFALGLALDERMLRDETRKSGSWFLPFEILWIKIFKG